MKPLLSSVTCIALSIGLLSGCANMNETQQGTAKGAGIGALAGAVLGAATGGSKGALTGAALGGAVGAGGGYLWSKKMQDQKVAMEQATAGTGVAVSQTADNRLKLDIPSDISFDVGRSATPTAPALTPSTTLCRLIAPIQPATIWSAVAWQLNALRLMAGVHASLSPATARIGAGHKTAGLRFTSLNLLRVNFSYSHQIGL